MTASTPQSPSEAPPETLGSCQLIRTLGSGRLGVVYEASNSVTFAPVAVKHLKHPDADAMERFQTEFRSLASISDHRNLIRLHELASDQGQWFFTMELLHGAQDLLTYVADVAGTARSGATPSLPMPDGEDTRNSPATATDRSEPLSAPSVRPPPTPTRGVDLDRVRAVFQQLIHGLAYLHRYNRLHRNLKPTNVQVTPQGRVVLLDYGLVRDSDALDPAVVGTADYVAPEHAGGLRPTTVSDWYAVGVLLFQALTQERPFVGTTSQILAWKQRYDAPSPADLRSGLPEDLVRLCCRLLQRDPLERPTGVDLIERQWSGTRTEPTGTPSWSLPPTQVFVGRTDHLTAMSTMLATARMGTTVVGHLQGSSGSGKSTLLDHFLRQAQAEGALVLRGRCGEHESVPFKGVDAVMDALTTHLLTLTPGVVQALLTPGTHALARMFPSLQRLPAVRDAPEPPTTAPGEATRQAGFQALADLLRGLAPRRTVVLALDDLQWSDPDSVALLEALLSAPVPPSILLLLVYRHLEGHEERRDARPDEPSTNRGDHGSDHSRAPALAAIRSLPQGHRPTVHRHDISVSGLTDREAQDLARALLGPQHADAEALAARIARESHGIAFFIHELVRHVSTEGHLAAFPRLDQAIASRLRGLSLPERAVLQAVALAGRPVPLRTLRRALLRDSLPIDELIALRDAHLIDCTGFRDESLVATAHDRIREITNGMELTSVSTQHLHAQLAQALEADGGTAPDILAEHFLGAGLADRSVHYLLRAGEHAAQRRAFTRAELAYRTAYDTVATIEQRIEVTVHLIHFYTDLTRFADAYRCANRALALLALAPLPATFQGPRFLIEWGWLELRRLRRTTADLAELPLVTNTQVDAGIRILNAVMKAAYQINPRLCVWLAVRSVNLCLRHGNARECAIGYMVYGAIFTGGIRGRYQTGADFGRLALSLVERHQTTAQRAEVHFVVGYFATSWRQPATEAERLWAIAYQAGIESGDLFHTGCAAAATIMSQVMRGRALEAIHVQARHFTSVLKRAHLAEPLGVIAVTEQAILNLRGLTAATDSFSDQVFNEAEALAALPSYGSRHFAHWYWILKMQCLYLWGHARAARAAAVSSASFLTDSKGMLQEAEHTFYAGLIALADTPGRAPADRARDRRLAQAAHRRFVQWAGECPENFLTREQILAGELARAAGAVRTALGHLREAIQSAQEFGQKPLHALALVLRARIHAARQDQDGAVTDRTAAAQIYRVWGADALADAVRGAPTDVRHSAGTPSAPTTASLPTLNRGESFLRLAQTPWNPALAPGLAVRPLLETAAALLQLGRASIWLIDGEPRAVRCVAMLVAATGELIQGLAVPAARCPRYCDALAHHRVMPIADALNDPRSAELADIYLRQVGVGALLDTPIWHAGAVAGLFCCAHVGGVRAWTQAEQYLAAIMSEYVELALALLRLRDHPGLTAPDAGTTPAPDAETARILNALSRRFHAVMTSSTSPTAVDPLQQALTHSEQALPPITTLPAAPQSGASEHLDVSRICREVGAFVRTIHGDDAIVVDPHDRESSLPGGPGSVCGRPAALATCLLHLVLALTHRHSTRIPRTHLSLERVQDQPVWRIRIDGGSSSEPLLQSLGLVIAEQLAAMQGYGLTIQRAGGQRAATLEIPLPR